MGKKTDPQNICPWCVKDCKQPPESILVSCSMYREPNKNLELFDSRGRVSPTVTKKKKKKENTDAGSVKRFK